MVAAVDQRDGDVHDREATKRPFLQRILHALLDRRDVLLGNGPAVDLLVELEAFAASQRPHLDDDVAELAVAARLLFVAAMLLDRPAVECLSTLLGTLDADGYVAARRRIQAEVAATWVCGPADCRALVDRLRRTAAARQDALLEVAA